jgi:hypothetical protein
MMSPRCRTLLVTCALLAFAAAPALANSHMEKSKPAAAKAEAKVDAKTADAKKAEPAMDPQMAEMIKNGTPNESHAKLKGMEGTWKATVKTWFAPGDPQVSEGVSENKLILGGRYLEQRYTGNMMGMPFEGYGLTGFDVKKGVYTTYWIDNMSTAVMSATASMDASGKTMTSTYTADGPDGKPMEYKNVTQIVDANSHLFTMYGVMGGKDVKQMEITYSRK